jgi:hypothetical protein
MALLRFRLLIFLCKVMTPNSYYTQSGRISWKSPIKPLITGLPWVILLAALYAVVIRYNPFIYFSFIATALFAALVGIGATMSAQSALSRSRLFNTAMGVCFGAFAVWVQWLVWLRISTDQTWSEVAHLGFSGPDVWLDYLGTMSRQWHLSISRMGRHGAQLSPAMLESVWWAEAIAIVLISAMTASMSGDTDAFNERSARWAKRIVDAELLADDVTADEWRVRIESHGAEPLLALPRAAARQAPAASTWHTLKVSCLSDETDADFCLITVERMTHSRKEDGKIKVRGERVLKLRFLESAAYRALVQHLQSTDTISGAASETQANPPELVPAIEALEASRYDEALTMALPHLAAADAGLQADAHRLCTLACSRLGRWPEAHAYFRTLFAHEESAQNALQVATTAIMSGQIEKGKTWFDLAWQRNLESREMPQPVMHSSYATALQEAGFPAEARPSVEWYKAAYIALPNTDPTYLFMHQMPLFSVFLEKSLPVLRACLTETEVVAWYQSMRGHLDDDGKTALDIHLTSMQGATVGS